ncbi:hypothetical protein [Arthrobacter sp. STN4]|uniref:hypothetical protein n=1 Tax=Arthrobacter sp. STN4 TaxID=2923276 RepID=UPI00211A2DB7|nr:hypothetical protein [Arthrobacter sp. STN4]MCQ9162945.1 hypothetical protein [Arthrobacter sp. STN4]
MAIPAPVRPMYRRRQKQEDFVVFGPADQITEVGPITVHLRSGATKQETILGLGAIFYIGETACRYGYLTENTRALTTKAPATAAAEREDVEPEVAMPAGPVSLDADDFCPDDGTDWAAEYLEATEAA